VTKLWSVSTEAGANLNADELSELLAAHHDRVIDSWQVLSPEQWERPSRNTSWTAHETARHVADCMDRVTAMLLGEPIADASGDFNPRETPEEWLASSADHSPAQTVERFATAAPRLRARVAERVEAGDTATGRTVYGPAHWSVNVVHLFWDSWLHERDILLPLGLPAESTRDEQRLAAIYGLLMAMVPARMMDHPLAASISFHGPPNVTVAAAHEKGQFTSAETPDSTTDLDGDLCVIVDALSGRGTSLRELLPEAPDLLHAFPDFMAS